MVRKFYQIIHQDVFESGEPKYSFGYYLIAAVWISILICTAYTITAFDRFTAFVSAATIFGQFQVNKNTLFAHEYYKKISKFPQMFARYILMRDLRLMITIADFLTDIYSKNTNTLSKYYGICRKYADFSKKIVIGCSLVYLGAVSVYQMPSMIIYFTTGEVTPASGMYFPFHSKVYEENSIEKMLLIVYNYVALVMAYLTLISYDSLIFLIFCNVPMASEIIRKELNELKVLIDIENRDVAVKDVRFRLLQIITMHKRYNE